MKPSFEPLLVPATVPVTRAVYMMGTRCVLTTYAHDPDAGQQQLETYLRILEDTENELSVWRPDTPLSRLNATPVGQKFHADDRLCRIFEEILFWWKETSRKFDPAIGRVLQVRGAYGPSSHAPEGPPIIGMQHIVLNREAQEIAREADVWIDPGCFGKGEGLDRVRLQAESEQAPPCLIDLGGQIIVHGRPPARTSWSIDIAHPQTRHRAVLTLDLTYGSLSTTGNSEQPGHVLNPSTGLPVDFDGSIIVWHERALAADIVSTAMFVMGPETGIKWANARGIAGCFLAPVRDQLQLRPTEAFAKRFTISGDTTGL